LTSLIATLIGVMGWIYVARSFSVSSFVLLLFTFGLVAFSRATLPFRMYDGGEVLLFGAAPWSLYAMRLAVNKSPILCLVISLFSAALLFFAKLTGLVVFAANVAAISLLTLVNQRRLNSSIIAMWVAAAVGVLCFFMLWVAHGAVPALRPWTPGEGSSFTSGWLPIWFSITGATFSGMSAVDFLGWFLGHPRVRIMSDPGLLNYVFGPLGLLLMVWVWFRLRRTHYRDMAILMLTIILLYGIAIAAMYFRQASVSFDYRHFRYAGILFCLLVLTTIDQWRVPLVKTSTCMIVIVFGLFGLKNFVTDTYAQFRVAYYDPVSGISQDTVSPRVVEYLRSETRRQNFQRPIAVLPSPSAAISLPRFRIMYIPPQYLSLEQLDAFKFAGRAEKIFLVVQEQMLQNGKAEAELRSFANYEFDKWEQMNLDGMVVYSQ
jgi:hypothetical protein